MTQHTNQPDTPTSNLMSLPLGFRLRDCWLVTNEKAPVDGVRWSDAERLLSFEEALERWQVQPNTYEVAYAFQADGPFIGVDFDDVRDPTTGEVDSEVKQALSQLNSYTEISSSGTGFHVLLTGEDPAENQRKASIGTGHVEVYDRKRYFVLTGERYQPDRLPENAKPAGSGFQRLLTGHFASDNTTAESGSVTHEPESTSSGNSSRKHRKGASTWVSSSTVTPAKIRATGAQFDSDFAKLWNGRSVHGCNDDSELDAKLVSRLVFYCRGDDALIDQCFRESARYDCRSDHSQPKWDEPHTGSGQTYGEHLIEEMKRRNSERYSGRYLRPDS